MKKPIVVLSMLMISGLMLLGACRGTTTPTVSPSPREPDASVSSSSPTSESGEPVVTNVHTPAPSLSVPQSAASSSDEESVKYLPAETARNEKLEAAIIKEIGFTRRDDIESTRYYYNIIDLNDDGVKEVFVELVGPYTSGTGGDTALLFTAENDSFKLIETFTLISNPVIVSDETTNGWHDLIMTRSGGGVSSQRVRMKFDGSIYPNPNKAEPVSLDQIVTGTAIISDDIAADFQAGKGLYLRPVNG